MSWELIVIALLAITLVWSWSRLKEEMEQSEERREYWQQWEQEYWLLRSSEAIKPNCRVYLSWLPRGRDSIIEWEEAADE